MRNHKVNHRLLELRQLIKLTGQATQDINLQGHWGRYLCVMTAGFLEYSLQTIYADFAASSSSPRVAQFVSQSLRRITNPNADRFLQTAGAFSKEWRDELSAFFDDDPDLRQGAINSIMSIRNKIVHGESVGITLAGVREYLDRSVKVLEFIELQCLAS